MLPGLLANYSIVGVAGAAYDVDIPIGGMTAAHVILAVMKSAPGEDSAGLDPGLFTAGAGVMHSDTEDTEGYALTVIYGDAGV